MRDSPSRSPPCDMARAKSYTVQRTKEARGQGQSEVADSNSAFGTYFGGRPISYSGQTETRMLEVEMDATAPVGIVSAEVFIRIKDGESMLLPVTGVVEHSMVSN